LQFFGESMPVTGLRQLVRICCGLCLAVGAVRGNTAGHDSASLPPELAALLDLPRWSNSVTLQTGFGYKDNVLLSQAGREASTFARGGVEAFLWRLPRGGTDYSAYVSAEGTRYLSDISIGSEAQAFGQFELRRRWGDRLKLALAVQGYHLDQVFDVSDTDVQRSVAELKVNGIGAGPSLRWAFGRGWFAETQGGGRRETFHDGSNDARLEEGALRLGWHRGERFEVTVSGTERRRRYASRVQYSAGGRALEGTALMVTEQEVGTQLEVVWDRAGRWKTRTRAAELQYEDNGSGYFNYRQRSVKQIVEWRGGAWHVGFEGSAARLDFEVQTVGFGIFPPPRIKDEFSSELRVERKLSPRWTAVAQYRWERSRCNDPLAAYRVNEGLLGARWSWEK
jgi:hypothetical protein